MKDVATKRGVVHISDDVDGVDLDERGFVRSLKLRNHGEHKVELVIDCTGFRGLLTQQTLGEPFEPYEDYLLNDRAAVMQIPHEDPKVIETATRSTALSSGWVFRIPLYSRIGTGYIFSSKFISDDQACDELVKLYGAQAKGATPRIIRMRTGRVRNSWVKNCIALGLSSGFIEPLEATAIFMTDLAVRWLYHYLPTSDFEPALAAAYNAKVSTLFEEVRDFVQAHYYLNNRKDTPYWIAAREGIKLTPSLERYLSIWQTTMPQELDLNSSYLFGNNVYALLLIAKGFYRGKQLANAPYLNPAVWKQYLRVVWDAKRKHLDDLPSHYDLLNSIRDGKVEVPRQRKAPAIPFEDTAVNLPRPSLGDIRFRR